MNAPDLAGWRHVYSGKVRDLYERHGADDRVLVVASDRVSAFDHVLSPGIPGKGALLTTLSLWWFDLLDVPNHLAATTALDADGDPVELVPAEVADRAMLVRRLRMLPVECVVRGYLTGSGWAEYRAHGTVCGIRLPEGLENGDRLPEPLFTPAYKAPLGEHDENITFDQTLELIGADLAEAVRDASLEVYRRAVEVAERHGLILADTKFEFGVDDDGVLTLADEVLTSDSSRYWDAETWRTGSSPEQRMASFDKQGVRDWLAASWDRSGEPPTLPPEVVADTAARYRTLVERLTGESSAASRG